MNDPKGMLKGSRLESEYLRASLAGALFHLGERELLQTATEMALVMTYQQARDALMTQLRQDAAAHEAEQYDAVGRRFDALEHRFPRGTAPELGRLHIALTFWDGWVHARNHGWPPGPIKIGEWPTLARAIADELAADRDISDSKVLTHFDLVAHPHLNERVQILAARLRQDSGR